jgi:hypothetical protein
LILISGTWAHLNGLLHKPLQSGRASVCVNPPIDARQRLGKNVTAATNKHAAIEEFLDPSFFFLYSPCRMKESRWLVLPRNFCYFPTAENQNIIFNAMRMSCYIALRYMAQQMWQTRRYTSIMQFSWRCGLLHSEHFACAVSRSKPLYVHWYLLCHSSDTPESPSASCQWSWKFVWSVENHSSLRALGYGSCNFLPN